MTGKARQKSSLGISNQHWSSEINIVRQKSTLVPEHQNPGTPGVWILSEFGDPRDPAVASVGGSQGALGALMKHLQTVD